jgi:hypothetical protein
MRAYDRHGHPHSEIVDIPKREFEEGGIQIDESDEQSQNAYSSIHKSLEFDSNVSVERERQSLKQYSQSFSIEEGIQIDESDEQS